ncbi:MAG: recombinase family protein [Candidatus Bipolaricaulaceae bacterium]
MGRKNLGKREPGNEAIGYCRVSTAGQAENGCSLEAQQAKIEEYCRTHGLVLREIIADAESGGVPLGQRPGGQRLLGLLKDPAIGHLVTINLDRLFRTVGAAWTHITGWQQEKITLHVIDFGGATLCTSGPFGLLFLEILAAFAEFERELIKERTKSALALKRAHLEAYSPTPYGFRRDGNRLIPVEEELNVIRRILDLKERGHSLGEIARTLEREGVRTKKGGRWSHETVRKIVRKATFYKGVLCELS